MTKAQILQEKSKYEFYTYMSIVSVVLGFLLFIPLPPLGLPLFMGGGFSLAFVQKGFKKVSITFKEHYVKEAILSIVENGTYEPLNGFSKEEVYGAKLLKKEDRYQSEDLITGELLGRKIRCADLHLQDVRSNGKSTSVVTVFRGKYFEVELDKPINQFVYIVQNRYYFFNHGTNLKKMEMEWVDFNQAFDVYGEDELETFKLLKPAFMEKLIGLKQYYKKISFGFIGKKLVIAINNGKDSFDIQLFKPLNEQFIDEIKKELMDLKDIIALLVE